MPEILLPIYRRFLKAYTKKLTISRESRQLVEIIIEFTRDVLSLTDITIISHEIMNSEDDCPVVILMMDSRNKTQTHKK